jgi:CubicO group peptidase (beta-lactamase class C family)
MLLVVLIQCVSCQSGVEQQTVWPTNGWPSSSPEEQGMDGAPLAALDQKFSNGDYGYVDHMLIIRRGHVVYDRSYAHDYEEINAGRDASPGMYNYHNPDWHPYYKGTRLHTIQSATKSVTSVLIGIAIGREEIPGVDVEIMDYFDEYKTQEVDANKRQITLEDLLTMRAGIEWDEDSYDYTDPRNSCEQMERSHDWIQFVMSLPMAQEPGEVFVYNSGASQLLSHIIKKSTGSYVDEYAERHLFKPLGIGEYYWKRTPTDLPDTEGGLYLTPHDLAKIGYLYLMDGVWEGERLLPEGWVQASVRYHVEDIDVPGHVYGYGYKWWLLPYTDPGKSHVYSAWGYGGQRLFVVPEDDLIAVFTGWNIYDMASINASVLFDHVLKAVERTEGR